MLVPPSRRRRQARSAARRSTPPPPAELAPQRPTAVGPRSILSSSPRRSRGRRRRREFPLLGTESDESSASRSSSIRRRRRRMNPEEQGEDNTGFGRGGYMPGFYGGWHSGMQPSQMYQYYPGPWTAALNQGVMPQQFPPPSEASPAPFSSIVPPTVDTVGALVMQESQVGDDGGSQKGGRRRKAAPTRSKLPNRHPKEDVFLVESWLEISQDPIVNTGQKREGFWARIVKQYNMKREGCPNNVLEA